MTRQEIEEAIQVARQGISQTGNRTYCEAWNTLVRVAEAWLGLDEWMVEMNYQDGTIGDKMRSLLNPTPKTDLQKVRAFLKTMPTSQTACEQLRSVDPWRVLDFIDQLEKEKP